MTEENPTLNVQVNNFPLGGTEIVFRHLALGMQGPLALVELAAEDDEADEVSVKITLSNASTNDNADVRTVIQEFAQVLQMAADNYKGIQ